jgi:ribosome silencing factor RsfS/YbeB/iojap
MNAIAQCTMKLRTIRAIGSLRTVQRAALHVSHPHARCTVCRASVDEEDLLDSEEDLETLAPVSDIEEDLETRDFGLAMAKIAWELKGEDLLLLHVAPVVYWTRYMLFVTVFSRPQLNAVLGKIEKTALEEFDMRPQSPGSAKSSWELLDFGSLVVHVLTADEREYYDLESFYAAADEVPLPFDDEAQAGALDWRSKL